MLYYQTLRCSTMLRVTHGAAVIGRRRRAFRRFLQKTLIPYSYFTAICPVNESRPNIGLYSATNDVMSVVICLLCLFGPCFWFCL